MIFVILSVLAWNDRQILIKNYALPELEEILGLNIKGEVSEFDILKGFSIKNLELTDKDRPIIKAKEVVFDLNLYDYTKAYFTKSKSNKVDFSKIKITQAVLSIRKLEDGTLLFFPENNKNLSSKSDTDKATKSSWNISALEIINSNVEIEIRSQKKQISFSNINLLIKNLGDSRLSHSKGSANIFYRDFGIDKFDSNESYKFAFVTKLDLDDLAINIDNISSVNTVKLNTNFEETYLYFENFNTKDAKFNSLINLDHSEGKWRVQSLEFLAKNPDLAIKASQIDQTGKCSLNVNISELDLSIISELFSNLEKTNINGRITDLKFEGETTTYDFNNVLKNLRGQLNFRLSDVLLPKQLIELVPFNILFLPLTTVGSVFEVIPANIIHDDLIDFGKNISDKLKNSQTFKIEEGEFNLSLLDDKIDLSEVKFGTDISGDIYLSGQVWRDQKIEIKSGYQVLGIKIPLPITGTLDEPIPDVEHFITGLVTEFGLSIVNLPITWAKRAYSIFDDEKGSKLDKH